MAAVYHKQYIVTTYDVNREVIRRAVKTFDRCHAESVGGILTDLGLYEADAWKLINQWNRLGRNTYVYELVTQQELIFD